MEAKLTNDMPHLKWMSKTLAMKRNAIGGSTLHDCWLNGVNLQLIGEDLTGLSKVHSIQTLG